MSAEGRRASHNLAHALRRLVVAKRSHVGTTGAIDLSIAVFIMLLVLIAAHFFGIDNDVENLLTWAI
ncbi:MAG TPA: hypothetical protein VFY36_00575 [Solirubrobacteraceae bacterium]|nr:hypothetical protein [Solirubrobacteraceae bacterium]